MLQAIADTYRTWSCARFEAELTAENLLLVEDYVDALNGDGSQITAAIRNTLVSAGESPIRNAYHLHELYEAVTFAERVFEA